jgi:tRNA-modifying protein YgfZ
MRTAPKVIALEDLGIVRIRGADAVKFLQGQLSNDVARLSAEHSLLTGYHNPQGRTIALLRLAQWAADDILGIVPRELAAVVATRLSKYVLRAKVKISDESAAWRLSGLVSADAAVAPSPVAPSPPTIPMPSTAGAQLRVDDGLLVCVDEQPLRWLVISPADGPTPKLDYFSGSTAGGSGAGLEATADRETWRRLDVAAGQPQVYAATSEEFVAQMLNLDVMNAIAFDKGCYTGQEVIARAHYRGRVKRRMQRFVSHEPCRLTPGDSGQLADGRSFKVVVCAQLADGRCDFLAVTALGTAESEAAPVRVLLADQASLPYSLPE